MTPFPWHGHTAPVSGTQSCCRPFFSDSHPPRSRALPDVTIMKSALFLAFTVYGIAAVISLFVATLIKGLFVVVRCFSR